MFYPVVPPDYAVLYYIAVAFSAQDFCFAIIINIQLLVKRIAKEIICCSKLYRGAFHQGFYLTISVNFQFTTTVDIGYQNTPNLVFLYGQMLHLGEHACLENPEMFKVIVKGCKVLCLNCNRCGNNN